MKQMTKGMTADQLAATYAEARQRVAMNVTELRVGFRWSQAQLARRAGVRKSTVEKMEIGQGKMRIDTLFAVARALGVDTGRLVEPRPTKPH